MKIDGDVYEKDIKNKLMVGNNRDCNDDDDVVKNKQRQQSWRRPGRPRKR